MKDEVIVRLFFTIYDPMYNLRLQQMSDFNMVNVESQGQTAKSMENILEKILGMDISNYCQLLPCLKELQNTSNKLSKQFHEYLSKKERKSAAIPYNMIRKFETLKVHLIEVQRELDLQTKFYGNNIDNREFEKSNEQEFFKRTLKSYDEKRLWMKAYILRNESRVQLVEEEVKRNIQYETHQFTQFLSEVNIERLEHNFDLKLDLIGTNQTRLLKNNRLRQQIATRIKEIRRDRKQSQPEKVIGFTKEQTEQLQILSCNKLDRASSFTPLLGSILTKKMLYGEYLSSCLVKITKNNKHLLQKNRYFKLALDKMGEKIESQQAQFSIINYLSSQRHKILSSKLTKTDFFIYLRQIHRYTVQILKRYGYYFQYTQIHGSSFPDRHRANSVSKNNDAKISRSAASLQRRQLLLALEQYRKDNISLILQARKQKLAPEPKDHQLSASSSNHTNLANILQECNQARQPLLPLEEGATQMENQKNTTLLQEGLLKEKDVLLFQQQMPFH